MREIALPMTSADVTSKLMYTSNLLQTLIGKLTNKFFCKKIDALNLNCVQIFIVYILNHTFTICSQ